MPRPQLPRPQHEAWMRRALSVASASPEDVPVGAVVYDAAGTELAAGLFANDTLPEDKASELQAVQIVLD